MTSARHSFESADAVCDIYNFIVKDLVSLRVARIKHLICSVILSPPFQCFKLALCLRKLTLTHKRFLT